MSTDKRTNVEVETQHADELLCILFCKGIIAVAVGLIIATYFYL